MAYTLTQLSGAQGQAELLNDVIAGFGLALSSTIVGVITRVVLLQFRVDLAARDKEARMELNQVMRQFHSELHSSVISTVEASTQIRQSLREHSDLNIEHNKRLQASLDQRLHLLLVNITSQVQASVDTVLEDGRESAKEVGSVVKTLLRDLTLMSEECSEALAEASEALKTQSVEMGKYRERDLEHSSRFAKNLAGEVSEVLHSTMEEVLEHGKDMNRRLSTSSRVNFANSEKAICDSLQSVNNVFEETADSFKVGFDRLSSEFGTTIYSTMGELNAVMSTASEEARKSIRTSSEIHQSELSKAIKLVALNIEELVDPVEERKGRLAGALDNYAQEAQTSRMALSQLVNDSRMSFEEVLEIQKSLADSSSTISDAARKLQAVSDSKSGKRASGSSFFGIGKRS